MTKIEPINSPSLWTGGQLADCEELFINFKESHLSEINHLISEILIVLQILTIYLKTLEIDWRMEKGLSLLKIFRFLIIALRRPKAFKFGFNDWDSNFSSSAGELIFSVKDSGYADDDPRSRGPNTRKKLSFHSDRCDVMGFLCLQQAIKAEKTK